MRWALVVANRARRQLGCFELGDQLLISEALTDLSYDPFAGDVKLLAGLDSLRCHAGNWRILYDVELAEKIVIVTAIRQRAADAQERAGT